MTLAVAIVAAGTAASVGGPARAAELRIEVQGLRSAAGTILVAVCPEAEFLQPLCSHVGQGPASGGVVVVSGVPAGTYAVQAVHDENDNGALDRPVLLPTEGVGFSRDAPIRRGPPRFADAAFALPGAGATVGLTMRYFQ